MSILSTSFMPLAVNIVVSAFGSLLCIFAVVFVLSKLQRAIEQNEAENKRIKKAKRKNRIL